MTHPLHRDLPAVEVPCEHERYRLIGEIVDRALPVIRGAIRIGPKPDRLAVFMDIDHADRDVPLDLEGLLYASERDFVHDVIGIYCHFNRDTKRLEDHFSPRFARRGGRSNPWLHDGGAS